MYWSGEIAEKFADALYAKVVALPLRWHESHHSGETIQRMAKSPFGRVIEAIRDKDLTTLGAVKSCTRAGTGCGGCVPTPEPRL